MQAAAGWNRRRAMPSLLPSACALRALLHKPATTRQDCQAIAAAMETLTSACRAHAAAGLEAPDEHMSLLQ